MTNLLPKNIFLSTLVVGCLSTMIMPAGYARESTIVSLPQTGRAFAQIAKEVSPAVVNIQSDQSAVVEDNEGEALGPEEENTQFFVDPRGQPYPSRRQPSVRQGSGFIISQDGYIVTNSHLVQNASKITVKLLDNKEYIASVVGSDPQSDVAVLKIEAKDLPIVVLGNSDEIEVGEWVVALGNPFGLSHSLSAGILSAKGRSSVGIADYENFLQTDAAINPGNSGGPLLDLDGKVVGINTAIFSRSGGNMGIGFAIPINMAKTIIEQLKLSGGVVRGYLGVRIQDLTKDLAAMFGSNVSKGILIAQIEPGSPSDKAGIKQGDIITTLDSNVIENTGDFRNSIAASKPGSKHNITIIRDNKPLQLVVKIGKLDLSAINKEDKVEEQQTISKLGLSVQNLSAEIASKLGYKGNGGVVVIKVKLGSIADLAGLNRGAIILEVNRKKVTNAKQLVDEVDKVLQSKKLMFLIQDQNSSRYSVLNLQ